MCIVTPSRSVTRLGSRLRGMLRPVMVGVGPVVVDAELFEDVGHVWGGSRFRSRRGGRALLRKARRFGRGGTRQGPAEIRGPLSRPGLMVWFVCCAGTVAAYW
jgi:hypothetical protein